MNWRLVKVRLLRVCVSCASWFGVATDKLLHWICSFVLMFVSGVFVRMRFALVATLCICLLKEVYDCFKHHPTGFSWSDILADVFGVVAAYLLLSVAAI